MVVQLQDFFSYFSYFLYLISHFSFNSFFIIVLHEGDSLVDLIRERCQRNEWCWIFWSAFKLTNYYYGYWIFNYRLDCCCTIWTQYAQCSMIFSLFSCQFLQKLVLKTSKVFFEINFRFLYLLFTSHKLWHLASGYVSYVSFNLWIKCYSTNAIRISNNINNY